LKGICSREEWDHFKEDVYYDYKKDNNFTEMRDAEILRERLSVLQTVDPYLGKYYSAQWVKKKILQMNDEEIEQMQKEIEEEEEQGIGQPVNQVGGEPQATAEQYPPENNTVEQGASESLTPMLDADVEKYSTILNRR